MLWIIFPSILSSFPVPAAKKTSSQHDAATPMLHHRDGARFSPDVTVAIQTKEFILGFIRPENLVSHGLRDVYVPFGKLQAGCHVPFTEEWLPSGHFTIKT